MHHLRAPGRIATEGIPMSEMELNFSSTPERDNLPGFPAKYPGFCKACHRTIYIGDHIQFDPGHETYVHIGCYTTPEPMSEPMPTDMCMVCWQAKALNGLCGCL